MNEIMANMELVCTVIGMAIAGLVSLFKGLPLVAAHPKAAAFALSTITGLAATFISPGFEWLTLVQCIVAPFAAAVATYEVQKTASDPAH